jgi:hypothetical protein
LDKAKESVAQYIKGTIDMPRILGADAMTSLVTWVDASYAVHPDMRSHTGGCMSFGTGVLTPKSMKQKLNTKSSTEAETVGGSDYVPNVIWTELFLEHQGIIIESNKFKQDNISTKRLITNGIRSTGPGSRHIDIRYFWMKNRLDTHNIDVEYCPTEEMLADFYTKPLQGALFKKFRDVIMGLKHITTLIRTPISTDQERVESNMNLGLNNESDNIDQNLHTVREKDKKTSDVSMTEYDATINIPVHRKSYADILKA